MRLEAASSLPAPTGFARPRGADEAGQEFEALLLGNLIAAAREASKPLGEESDNASESYLDFADTELARSLARAQPLGIARILLRQQPSGLKGGGLPADKPDSGG